MNGWGVFSTIKIVDGCYLPSTTIGPACARRRTAARSLSMETGGAGRNVVDVVEANRDFNATLRVAVVRNQGTIGRGASKLDVI